MAGHLGNSMRSLSRSPKPSCGWTLADTYGFMSSYAHKQGGRPRGPELANRFDRISGRRGHSSNVGRKPPQRTQHGSHMLAASRPDLSAATMPQAALSAERRRFHDYFVTHLPSSSLHPDSQSPRGQHHKMPRSASSPHTSESGTSPAAMPMVGLSREMTVVRIPLRSAKHHFGVSISRGTRPYNEDAYQAGVINIPAFARKSPVSLTRSPKGSIYGEGTSADSASGDPQVFYFGVFDGHGGAECSGFLKESLHKYIEDTADLFDLKSSVRQERAFSESPAPPAETAETDAGVSQPTEPGSESVEPQLMEDEEGDEEPAEDGSVEYSNSTRANAVDLERALVRKWSETVGGYFRRFRPEYFDATAKPSHRYSAEKAADAPGSLNNEQVEDAGITVEAVMTYAFLKADLDFILAQAEKQDEDPVRADKALNENEILGETHKIGGKSESQQKRFKGGSTCSVAMISTPTATPFWHPTTPSTLLTAHVGDTRILLCSTETGSAIPLTTNHHPSTPSEGRRLRRYAASFVTDSFGEERMSGLANTRAFGDIQSKRVGVSAEPEIQRLEIKPAEYSFAVLVSDGISGTLNDQEIVDIVKEARTPEQGAKDVISFATGVTNEGDNATCMVIRLGGWERRIEGGLGAMGTREVRDWRRQEAAVPRRRT